MECIEKISPVRLQEVEKLHMILERIQLALAQPAGVRTPLKSYIENQPSNDQNNIYQPVQHQNIFRYVECNSTNIICILQSLYYICI